VLYNKFPLCCIKDVKVEEIPQTTNKNYATKNEDIKNITVLE
jgi:hypothetical protein